MGCVFCDRYGHVYIYTVTEISYSASCIRREHAIVNRNPLFANLSLFRSNLTTPLLPEMQLVGVIFLLHEPADKITIIRVISFPSNLSKATQDEGGYNNTRSSGAFPLFVPSHIQRRRVFRALLAQEYSYTLFAYLKVQTNLVCR